MAIVIFVVVIAAFSILTNQTEANDTMDMLDKLATAAELLTNASLLLIDAFPKNSSLILREMLPGTDDELRDSGLRAHDAIVSFGSLIIQLEQSGIVHHTGSIMGWVNEELLPSPSFNRFLSETMDALPVLYEKVQTAEAQVFFTEATMLLKTISDDITDASHDGTLRHIVQNIIELTSNRDVYAGIHSAAELASKMDHAVQTEDFSNLARALARFDFGVVSSVMHNTSQLVSSVLLAPPGARENNCLTTLEHQVGDPLLKLVQELAWVLERIHKEWNEDKNKFSQVFRETEDLVNNVNKLGHLLNK